MNFSILPSIKINGKTPLYDGNCGLYAYCMLMSKNIVSYNSLRNYYCLIEIIRMIKKLKLRPTTTHFEMLNILLKGKKMILINGKTNLKDKNGLLINSKFQFNKFDDKIFKEDYKCHFNVLINNFVFESNYAYIFNSLEYTIKTLTKSEFHYFIELK